MQEVDAKETIDATGHSVVDGLAGPAPRARLVGVYPPDLRVEIDLDETPVTLGRTGEPPFSVAIPHPKISRAHVELGLDLPTGRFVARDLDSRNGSWVSGVRVGKRSQALEDGCVLRLGDVLLVLEKGVAQSTPDSKEVDHDAIPGRSLGARALRDAIARAAPDPSPALVLGETGTGKERIASEIHRVSGRRGRFVAVNCATLGAQLAESQLFGHKKGAFTGATNDQEGLFGAADGGTLFLDEIGELPLDLQPKLLRAIQEREVRAVGSTRDVSVDVRVVAATHRDLARAVEGGSFRRDLLARLALWELRAPPLRSRRVDVLGWVQRLNARWREERGLDARAIDLSPDAAERILSFDWPENLRGLVRLVHELAAKRIEGPLRAKELPAFLEGRP